MALSEEQVISTHSIDGTKLYISYGKAFVSRSLAILYAEKQSRQVSLDKEKAGVEERFARKAEPALREGRITSPYRAYIGDGKLKSPAKNASLRGTSPSGRGGFAAHSREDDRLNVSNMTASAVLNLQKAMEAVKQISQAASRPEPSVRHAATSPLPSHASDTQQQGHVANSSEQREQHEAHGRADGSTVHQDNSTAGRANDSVSSKACERCGRLEKRIVSLERTLQASTEAIEGLRAQVQDRSIELQAAKQHVQAVEKRLQDNVEAAAIGERALQAELQVVAQQALQLRQLVESRRGTEEEADVDADADADAEHADDAEEGPASTATSRPTSRSPYRTLAARPAASLVVVPHRSASEEADDLPSMDQNAAGAPTSTPPAPEPPVEQVLMLVDRVKRVWESLETPPRPQPSSAMGGFAADGPGTTNESTTVPLSVLQSPLPKSPPLPGYAGPSSMSSAGSRASTDTRTSPASSVQPTWPSPPLPALPPPAATSLPSPAMLTISASSAAPFPGPEQIGVAGSGSEPQGGLHIRSPQAQVAAPSAHNPFDTPTDRLGSSRGVTAVQAVGDASLSTPPRSGRAQGARGVQGRAISSDGAVPASPALSSIYNAPGTPSVLGVALGSSSPFRTGVVGLSLGLGGAVSGVPASPLGLRNNGTGVLGAVLGLPMALGAASAVGAENRRIADSPARQLQSGNGYGQEQGGPSDSEQHTPGASGSTSQAEQRTSSSLDDSVRI